MRQGGRGMRETRSLHQFMHECARKEIGQTPYFAQGDTQPMGSRAEQPERKRQDRA
jgi:hypothetical protein